MRNERSLRSPDFNLRVNAAKNTLTTKLISQKLIPTGDPTFSRQNIIQQQKRNACVKNCTKKIMEWNPFNLEQNYFLIFPVSSSIANKKILKKWGHRLSF